MHFLVPSLTFLTIGGFTLPISGGFNLRKFGGAKLLITRPCAQVKWTWREGFVVRGYTPLSSETVCRLNR